MCIWGLTWICKDSEVFENLLGFAWICENSRIHKGMENYKDLERFTGICMDSRGFVEGIILCLTRKYLRLTDESFLITQIQTHCLSV